MAIDPPNNIVHFPGLQAPEQEADPHRNVITSLTDIIRQMSDLVNAINSGPATDADKVKFATWLCTASALCLRAQMEYFDQFVGDSKTIPGASSFDPPQPPSPST